MSLYKGLLNLLVQIANKMGLHKSYSINTTAETTITVISNLDSIVQTLVLFWRFY
jgi:hypothetical protein